MNAFLNFFFSAKVFPFLFLSHLIFSCFHERKRHGILKLSVGFLLCSVLSFFLWNWVRTMNYIQYVSIFIRLGMQIFLQAEIALIVYLAFEIEPLELVLYALCSWFTEHLANSLTYIVAMQFSMDGISYPNYSLSYFFLTLGIYASIYLILFFFSSRQKETKINPAKKHLLMMAAIGCLTILTFQYFVYYRSEMSSLAVKCLKIYETFICIVCLALVFSVLDVDRMKKEYAVLDQLDKQRMEQYVISKETIEALNTRCHDLKKYTSLSKGELLTQEERNALAHSLSVYENIVKTGHGALDVILTEKSLYCLKKGIRLNVMASSDRLGFLTDMDVYALFGNILDNAIEAVEGLEEEKRMISLSVKGNENILVVHEDNCCRQPLRQNGRGMQTTKEDKINHGYGLLSIRRVAEKYGGEFSVFVKGEMFSIDVLIPIPET